MELSELDRASAMAADFTGDWVRSGFVKMFMDGVVDSRTAYMLHDYPGTTERGAPLFSPERFNAICTEIDRRGLQIAVHAIGDGAVRQTIDGYEAAGRPELRHRIVFLPNYDIGMARLLYPGTDIWLNNPVVTREAHSGALDKRIPQLITEGSLQHACQQTLDTRSQVMLCGNPQMINDSKTVLESLGLTKNLRRNPGNITVEQYWK